MTASSKYILVNVILYTRLQGSFSSTLQIRGLILGKFEMVVIFNRVIYYDDVIMSAIASQITSLTIVYSTVNSDADERKHQSSASLAFVRGIHRRPVNSTHNWPGTRKMFPFDDAIMNSTEYKELGKTRDTIIAPIKKQPSTTYDSSPYYGWSSTERPLLK